MKPVPLLILHGGDDSQVGPLHALRMATRLEELHRPYGLQIVGGEGHVLQGVSAERDLWVVRWFDRFRSTAPLGER